MKEKKNKLIKPVELKLEYILNYHFIGKETTLKKLIEEYKIRYHIIPYRYCCLREKNCELYPAVLCQDPNIIITCDHCFYNSNNYLNVLKERKKVILENIEQLYKNKTIMINAKLIAKIIRIEKSNNNIELTLITDTYTDPVRILYKNSNEIRPIEVEIRVNNIIQKAKITGINSKLIYLKMLKF